MFTNIKAVRVQKVIMQSIDPAQSGSVNIIGSIRFNELNDPKPNEGSENSLFLAKPLFNNIFQPPAVNEIVHVIAGPKDSYNIDGHPQHYYFPPINVNGSPNHNAVPSELTEEEIEARTETSLDYFREIENIRPLQPYKGDFILNGRYGQSLRFGSTIDLKNSEKPVPNNWSNEGTVGSPITIIRNGQTDDVDTKPPFKASYDHILEDINGDDSSIYLCSNQTISNFQKAGIYPNEDPLSYKHMK